LNFVLIRSLSLGPINNNKQKQHATTRNKKTTVSYSLANLSRRKSYPKEFKKQFFFISEQLERMLAARGIYFTTIKN
jgi:hypothetical protein